MTPRLRPRWKSLEGAPAWSGTPDHAAALEAVYADLLRCRGGDREEAIRALVRSGISEDEARRIGPSYLTDYAGAARRLRRRHGFRGLVRAGLLSARGHLIFYRHRLLLPIRHRGRLLGVAGRALDGGLRPRTLLPHGLLLPAEARGELGLLLALLDEGAVRPSQLELAFRLS
ncbi:MAG: hypothetical protein ACREID_00995 [Planctomycetota bacterium]